MAQKTSVAVKAAYITVAGAVAAALIAGVFSIMDKTEAHGTSPITQTVGGSGVGVINTGSGVVNVKP